MSVTCLNYFCLRLESLGKQVHIFGDKLDSQLNSFFSWNAEEHFHSWFYFSDACEVLNYSAELVLWIPGRWMPSLPHVVLMRWQCLPLELCLSSRGKNSSLFLLKRKSIWGWFTMKTICSKTLLVLDHWNLWWILGVEWNMGGGEICLTLSVLGSMFWPYGWERTSVFFPERNRDTNHSFSPFLSSCLAL